MAWDLFKFFAGDEKDVVGADEYYGVLVDKLKIIRAPEQDGEDVYGNAMGMADGEDVYGNGGFGGDLDARGEPLSSYIESLAPGVEEMQ